MKPWIFALLALFLAIPALAHDDEPRVCGTPCERIVKANAVCSYAKAKAEYLNARDACETKECRAAAKAEFKRTKSWIRFKAKLGKAVCGCER